jgi:putative transposase
VSERKGLIEPNHPILSKRAQSALLGISRTAIYYHPKGHSEEDLTLMRAIDEEYLKHPHYGRRSMTWAMRDRGFLVGEKHVRTLMQTMGLEAIYPKPNLSVANQEHKKFPYLLRGMVVDQPDQVWAADITFVPLQNGFGYLFAIIDWYSRYTVEWELSNLLDAEFCVMALQRALSRRKPGIFNTDQGVQFTSRRFVSSLEVAGIQISMDGKGRALDNVFVERLWRSVKYEEIYPKGYESMRELEAGLTEYFTYYNEIRRHQGLELRTPADVYFGR